MVNQFTFVAPLAVAASGVGGGLFIFCISVGGAAFYVNFYERAHQIKLIPKIVVDFVSFVTGLAGLVAVGFELLYRGLKPEGLLVELNYTAHYFDIFIG